MPGYVALGDSQTEGVGDGDDVTGLRGWADRLAEHMARHNPGLVYANLAVRGRLAGQAHAEQLAPALALRPDVATVVAGVNDLLRPASTPTRSPPTWRRCSPHSPPREPASPPSPSPTSPASPRWCGPYATASPPSTTASAGPRTGRRRHRRDQPPRRRHRPPPVEHGPPARRAPRPSTQAPTPHAPRCRARPGGVTKRLPYSWGSSLPSPAARSPFAQDRDTGRQLCTRLSRSSTPKLSTGSPETSPSTQTADRATHQARHSPAICMEWGQTTIHPTGTSTNSRPSRRASRSARRPHPTAPTAATRKTSAKPQTDAGSCSTPIPGQPTSSLSAADGSPRRMASSSTVKGSTRQATNAGSPIGSCAADRSPPATGRTSASCSGRVTEPATDCPTNDVPQTRCPKMPGFASGPLQAGHVSTTADAHAHAHRKGGQAGLGRRAVGDVRPLTSVL